MNADQILCKQVPSDYLEKFQKDLNSMRYVIEDLNVSNMTKSDVTSTNQKEITGRYSDLKIGVTKDRT